YALSKVFYGAMQRLGQCVVHHLIGRYVKRVKSAMLCLFGLSRYRSLSSAKITISVPILCQVRRKTCQCS
ncbi:hypothetical protein, partial [Vibrio aestuarianus]|nr:hypothetical protein [Vibrio aestuarianus]